MSNVIATFDTQPMYDKMGWGIGDLSVQEKHDTEKAMFETARAANPFCFEPKTLADPLPEVKKKFDEFQKDCGRLGESYDLSIIDYFVFGKRLLWFPQDTGSCVWSNTFRIIVERMMAEIALRGDPEEYFGRDNHGINNIAPHFAQYGFARELANMRGGDGLYAGPMAQSLAAGMVMCSNPKVIELHKKEGADSPYNYPEPRSTALYRKVQNWAWNQALKEYRDYRVTEIPKVNSAEELWNHCKQYKTAFICSSIAIGKKATHKDGFTIHVQDTGNRWDHNMGISGCFTASDGERFFRESNRSWKQNQQPDRVITDKPRFGDEADQYMYNLPYAEVDRWFKRGMLDTYAIGEIQLPEPVPNLVG